MMRQCEGVTCWLLIIFNRPIVANSLSVTAPFCARKLALRYRPFLRKRLTGALTSVFDQCFLISVQNLI